LRYFIELAYNGKAYHGWQIQPNAITVQEVIQKSLSTILRTPIAISGCGRTDTGVHAKKFYAHFDVETSLNCNSIKNKLNSFLPDDIAIYDIFLVQDDAHARFDANSRTYTYFISTQKNPFTTHSAFLVKKKLDIELIKKASKLLLTYTDFQCFSRSNTDVKTFDCDIKKAEWTVADGQLIFTIQADRFLRNMVRAIVGTLLDLGLKKIDIEEFKEIIESKNRSKAGASVPGHALFLADVSYPNTIKVSK
jgi:tRNA pseudouridine38-40 synthase